MRFIKKKKISTHWQHALSFFFFTFMVNFDCNLFQVMIEPRRINVRGIISVQPDTGSGGGAIVFLVFFPLFFFFSTIRWKKIAYSHQRTVYCNQLRIQFALIIRIPITGPFDSPTSVRFFFFFNPTVPLSLVSPITICLAVYFFFFHLSPSLERNVSRADFYSYLCKHNR